MGVQPHVTERLLAWAGFALLRGLLSALSHAVTHYIYNMLYTTHIHTHVHTHTHDTMTTLSGAGAAFVCVYFCFAQPTRRAASNFYLFISISLSLPLSFDYFFFAFGLSSASICFVY